MTFPNLDLETLNVNGPLKDSLMSDVLNGVATAARVDPSQVSITAIVAGSVVVRRGPEALGPTQTL
eukprot:7475944-Pyramimonas_sp.AAC.1